MAVKGILHPTLEMILKTHYSLPVKHQPSISPSSDIPPSQSPLPSAGSKSLGNDQIEESEYNYIKTRANDDMAWKHRNIESKR